MGAYPAHTEKLLAHIPAMTNIVRRIAEAAGAVVMDHYDPSGYTGRVISKDDGSPVTEADLAADALIRDALHHEFAGIPIITEETVAGRDHDLLGAMSHYWLVDPVDGTKHFRDGNPDFSVQIALIEQDRPVLGVIYAPAHGEGFAGDRAGTSLRWLNDGREHEAMVRTLPPEGLTLITNRTDQISPRLQTLIDQIKVAKHIRRGSTLKFGDVAAGRADLYPRFKDTYFWDSAPGEIILQAAGGFVVDWSGQPLRYDRNQPDLCNGGFVACSDLEYMRPVLDELHRLKLFN